MGNLDILKKCVPVDLFRQMAGCLREFYHITERGKITGGYL